jgi:hypothetical protein
MPVLLPLRGFGYPEFCKMMEDEKTVYIRKQIEDFVQSFCKACGDETMLRQSSGMFPTANIDEEVTIPVETDSPVKLETLLERQKRRGKEYLKIIESFALVILKDPFWILLSADGKTELDHDSDEMALYFELVFSFLEIYIVPQIHRYLFVPDKKSDWDIAVKCLEYEWIRPIHLDLRFLPEDLSLLIDKANNIFTEMAFEPIPSLKASHLGTIWKLIEVFLMASRGSIDSSSSASPTTNHQSLPSMDDIFPILVYTIIKTHPPQLSSDLEYLCVTCREMTTFGSFTSFYVTNTQVALEFVKNLSQEKLSKESDENLLPSAHSAHLREVLAKAVPITVFATEPTSLSFNHTVDSATKQIGLRLTNVKDRLSKTVGKVAGHVSGTVSLVSSFSPISAVASVVRSPQKQLASSAPSSTASTEQSLASSSTPHFNDITASWVDTEHDPTPESDQQILGKTYRFYNSVASELSSEDISQLLNDYKALAQFHFSHS